MNETLIILWMTVVIALQLGVIIGFVVENRKLYKLIERITME